jgi:Spy/CpxP family protein refolding chaperone
MDIFAEKKLLIRLIIVLALLNMVSIGVFLWKGFDKNKPPQQKERKDNAPKDRKDIAAVLEEELELSKTQVEQIQNLRAEFMDKEDAVQQTIRNKRDSMNVEMFNKNTNDDAVKSLARGIADLEYQKEILRYEQSKAFKAICTPEQLEKFEDLVKEIKNYFKPKDPQKKNR